MGPCVSRRPLRLKTAAVGAWSPERPWGQFRARPLDEVPQRRPGPPYSSSCLAKLPSIWKVLWGFFLFLQLWGRHLLKYYSLGVTFWLGDREPWCGAAVAEVSKTEPGLKQATLEARAMAIATSVSSPGKGGLPGRDLQPALRHSRVYFYPLCYLLSQKLCPLSFVPFSLSVLIPLAFWFWVGPSSSLPILFLYSGCR